MRELRCKCPYGRLSSADRRALRCDRQQVNARARASACWSGGRRRPTRAHYLCRHHTRN
jgi:hypothetical protein